MAEGFGGVTTEIRTFLIADVRGYTRFTSEHGDEAGARLAARFAEVVGEEIASHGGTVVELRGDEALCVFGSPRGALRAAVGFQRRCADELRADPSLPLRVGIGIDAGEAVAVGAGYRGGPLNLAARLCSIAGPGEVLVSEGIVHLARRVDEVSYVDRGRVELKGMDEPVHVMQLTFELDMPDAASATSRRWTRERLAALVGGIIVVAALVGVAVLRIEGGHAPVSLGTNVVGFADTSGHIVGQVPLGGRPGGVAVGAGSVWATDTEHDSVVQINNVGRVVDKVPVGVAPTGVAVGGGGVWVADSGGGAVSWVSSSSPGQSTSIPVGQGPGAIAYGGGSAWVVNATDGTLQRIDAKLKPSVARAIGGAPAAVAFGDGWVWVTDTSSSSVLRVNPKTRQVVARLAVGNSPVAVAFGGHRVWVANAADGTVTSLDPATNRETEIPVGRDPTSVAYTNGAVWVAVGQPPSLVRIDARLLHVDSTPTDSVPQAVAASADRTWVTALAPPASHRGGTLRVVAKQDVFGGFFPPDPARPIFVAHWQVLSLTNDGLVTYRRVGGPAGAQVVPDLAASMPTVSDGGRTYTFQLRPGLHYSNGQPVRASDFRYAVERQFRYNANASAANGCCYFQDVAFSNLVGYSACEDAPTTCSLADAIKTDNHTRTITILLKHPDPALPQQLATTVGVLVPPGSPPPGSGKPVPATGPYMISTHANKHGLLLVRNPHFHQWSADAQPAGYPDELRWSYRKDASSELTAVEQGTADTMVDSPPPDRVGELQTLYAARTHPYANLETTYMDINTRAAPFNQVDVRRAVNLAIDRDRAAKLLGGQQLQAPTCQVLPPGIPGYAPYCPYTANPTPSGVWSGPDVARAQQLIRASGTRGTPVTIWVRADPVPHVALDHLPNVTVGRYLATVLRQIGYPTTVHLAESPEFFPTVANPRRRIQISLGGGWLADYPSPIDFFDILLTCHTAADLNVDEFCDPHFDTLVHKADAAQATDPARAVKRWQEADREAVNQAPWVPLTNNLGLDVVSARVGNYQHNPQWGILLDQLWVK